MSCDDDDDDVEAGPRPGAEAEEREDDRKDLSQCSAAAVLRLVAMLMLVSVAVPGPCDGAVNVNAETDEEVTGAQLCTGDAIALMIAGMAVAVGYSYDKRAEQEESGTVLTDWSSVTDRIF